MRYSQLNPILDELVKEGRIRISGEIVTVVNDIEPFTTSETTRSKIEYLVLRERAKRLLHERQSRDWHIQNGSIGGVDCPFAQHINVILENI